MMDSKLCMNGWDKNAFSKLVHSYSHPGCWSEEAALVILIQGYNICKKLQCKYRQ